MALEDYTGYAETDEDGDLTVAENTITISTMRRDALSHVIKNKGANHFGDFEHLVSATHDEGSGDWAHFVPWGISDSYYCGTDMEDNDEGIYFDTYEDDVENIWWLTKDCTNDNLDYYHDGVGTKYFTIERSGTTLTVKIYSDSDRLNLVDTLAIVCTNATYSTIVAVASWHSSNHPDSTISGSVFDLNLQEAAGTQTLYPDAIASAEAIGTLKANFGLAMSGIATAEALGSPQANLKLAPSAIASAEALGTAKLDYILAMTGISSEEAIGSHALGGFIGPDGIESAEAIGSHQLNLPLALSGIESAEAFGTPKLIFYLLPSGIATAEALGSPALGLYLIATGISSAEAFGSPQLNLSLALSGIASAEALGKPALGTFITAQAIASGEALGSPQLNFILLMTGIESAEAFGNHLLRTGVQDIYPDGILSAEALGSLIIFQQYVIAVNVYWSKRALEAGWPDRDIEIRWPKRNIEAGFRDVG